MATLDSSTAGPSGLADLKRAHRSTWGSGNYGAVAERLIDEVPPRHLLEAVGIEPGMEVLDIATGTGSAARGQGHRSRPHARTIRPRPRARPRLRVHPRAGPRDPLQRSQRPRRQRMHARAADAIEATAGEPPVAALAVQYRLAGPAGDLEKAIGYLPQAGAQASELSAWDEAAAHWEGAQAAMAAVGGREREQAELLLGLGDVMGVAGDIGRQISHLEQALALFEQLGDEERAAQAHSRLGMAHGLIDRSSPITSTSASPSATSTRRGRYWGRDRRARRAATSKPGSRPR